MSENKHVIQVTDDEAIRLAKSLLRTARFGALAVIEKETGVPWASRVGVATDTDGTPLILISMLAAHTGSLLAEPHCSLLVGEPGKGDPLAHPRLTLVCAARRLERDEPDGERAKRRYLNRNPKAKLYADLGDFSFFRLEIERASLNGGFGKAYLLAREQLLCGGPAVGELAASEQQALDHMNADHRDAINVYANHFAKAAGTDWRLTGLDTDGMDLASGDRSERVFFDEPLQSAADLRPVLVEMAKRGRAA
jgi:putative heme iron utilization protein